MNNATHASDQFDPEFTREPIGRSMIVAVLFHVALIAGGIGLALSCPDCFRTTAGAAPTTAEPSPCSW